MKEISFIILLGIMFGTFVIFDSSDSKLINNAYGYNQYGCKWDKDILSWSDGGNLTSTNLSNIREVMSNYNQIPVNMFFEEIPSNSNLVAYSFNFPSDSARGFSLHPCPLGQTTITGPLWFGINEPAHQFSSNQKKQATWSHEVGHTLGLGHPTGTGTNNDAANMKPTATSYDTYGIFVPVLDDIRGLRDYYGSPNSTPQCTQYTSNGVILYGGSCDGENSSLSTHERVTVAGSQNRAFASDTPSGILMPDSDTLLLTTIVQPNTLYRFSTGIHTNTNVADTSSRYATVEVNNNGIFASWTNLAGFTSTSTLSNTTPTIGTEYFLQIVSQKNEDSTAYAYINDAVGASAPTFLGSAKFTPGPTWSGIKYFGTGVWTDSPTDPLSNYSVNQYHHLSSCLPNLNLDWESDYDCVLPKSASTNHNVIIDNNSQLIVPVNVTMDVDFENNHLTIKEGSSVIIRNTAKID